MAGNWEGFTEEDIGFYRKNDQEPKEPERPWKDYGRTHESIAEVNLDSSLDEPFRDDEEIVPKKKAVNLQNQKNSRRETVAKQTKNENEIPEGAKLCQKTPETVPLIEPKQTEKEREAGPTITGSNPVCLKVIEGKAYELVDRNSADPSKATLEVFEARQKMLEEQNRRRKEVLSKVISARKKQTTEEAKRLQHIHEELQKLDMLLSNDVGILRNKIEEASLDFVEAQKRYNKAEKEFLDAKQNLFVKLEKKELLTKLLCTIIEQNELRKAQKLSELMEKLNIKEASNSVILVPENQSALKEQKEAGKEREGEAKQPS